MDFIERNDWKLWAVVSAIFVAAGVSLLIWPIRRQKVDTHGRWAAPTTLPHR
jgi:hypothetical protein